MEVRIKEVSPVNWSIMDLKDLFINENIKNQKSLTDRRKKLEGWRYSEGYGGDHVYPRTIFMTKTVEIQFL